MHSLILAAAALVLFGISYFLIRKTSAYTRAGGDAYVRRVRRKMIGMTLLFTAILLSLLAIGAHEASSPETLPPPEAIATEPYVPPVLPQPSENDILASREAPMKFTDSSDPGRQRPPSDNPFLAAESLKNPSISAPELPLPPAPAPAPADAPPQDSPPQEAPPTKLATDEKSDDALANLIAQLKTDPNNAKTYGEIGNIYASRQAWTEAQINYEKSLALDGTNASIKYNLAQMQFVQKKYDDARPGFVALEKDIELGDLALYKTFLCDLYGGHADAAAKELDAFNQSGENASYYFANAASSLYQKKTEDARGWLDSASHIYSQQKFTIYSADLVKLGYLPLPAGP